MTPYAESKVLVEADVSKLASTDFSPTFMRNATVYGSSAKLRGDLVVNNLVGWAFCTGQVHMKSDGSPWRPLVHVKDVCEAFSAVLAAPRDSIHNEAFNIGRQGENYRISDVAEHVKNAIAGSRITFAEDAGPDPRCYRVDFQKLATAFPALQLSWNVERGVRELLARYTEVGLTEADLEGDRYLRIRRIERLLEENRIDSDLRWRDA